MMGDLVDIDSTQWVFVVGWLGFNYPMGVFGTDEEILQKIEAHPKWIFFMGPKSLSEVNWSEKMDQQLSGVSQVLAELWAESQGDRIKIRDAGIIQDCVMRVAAAVGITDYE